MYEIISEGLKSKADIVYFRTDSIYNDTGKQAYRHENYNQLIPPRPRVTASQLAHFQSRPKAKNIVPATDLFDPAHPLFDKTCVLTGELLKLSDREAMQRIADCGGKNADNVTKKTDFLIVGGGSPSEKKSGKVRKAEEYIEKGIPIRIISEEEFLQM